jgi:chemotaxis regulatin CheY-phosphate phosphatase CheZ
MIDVDPRTGSSAVASLPNMLLSAYGEICAVINNLRDSRDMLHKTTVTRLQDTTSKLLEVSNATEVAATSILDGLDRSLGIVDQLEALDGSGAPQANDLRNLLRDELYQAQAFLQFQDITTQQLNYASSILVDLEQRLVDVARTIDPTNTDLPEITGVRQRVPTTASFDPNATVEHAEVRQALADSIFKNPE